MHITTKESSLWRNDRAFRDYLINNPHVAKQYKRLKEDLSEKYAGDRGSYIKGKEVFIKSIISKCNDNVRK